MERRLSAARLRLDLCAELYRDQVKSGRYFLHENPWSVESWHVESIVQLEQSEGVDTVVGHMCQYGMEATDDHGAKQLVLKPAKWMIEQSHLLAGRTGQEMFGRS